MINPEVVEKNNNDWRDHNQNDLLSGFRDAYFNYEWFITFTKLF